jgi:hypothetical protein
MLIKFGKTSASFSKEELMVAAWQDWKAANNGAQEASGTRQS